MGQYVHTALKINHHPDSRLNWIVAGSNVSFLHPIYISVINKDYATTAPIVFVTIMSFLSHCVENHKHGMVGAFSNLSENASVALNQLDVAGCVWTFSRFLWLFYKKYIDGSHGLITLIVSCRFQLACSLASMAIGRISEYDKYNPKLRYRYVWTHCVWHWAISASMSYFLQTVIY